VKSPLVPLDWNYVAIISIQSDDVESQILTARRKKCGMDGSSPCSAKLVRFPAYLCTSSTSSEKPFHWSFDGAFQRKSWLANGIEAFHVVELVIKVGRSEPSGASRRSYGTVDKSCNLWDINTKTHLCDCLEYGVKAKLGRPVEKHTQSERLIDRTEASWKGGDRHDKESRKVVV
jgi:hypothetical protein